MLNGVMIAVGSVGVLDNLVFHWFLELHRAVPGRHALHVEIGLVIVSATLFGIGLWRESRARRPRRRS